MLRAVIFDLDGLLIDSEPWWRQAETEVFASVGLELTAAMCRETVGLRLDAMVAHWFERRAWTNKTTGAVGREIAERVVELVRARATPMHGAEAAIAFFVERAVPLSVCSSSPLVIIEAVLETFGLRRHFGVVHSADAEEFGKPHPAPYLAAARRLGVEPGECLAFEDSLNGAISAKAARMKVVAVPEAEHPRPSVFDFCDARLGSLAEVSEALLEGVGLLPPR